MQKVTISLVDDMDGSEAAETVTFGLDGTRYEIDLSNKNAKQLRKALDAYVASARRVAGSPARSRKSNGGPAPAKVRAWAEANGVKVNKQGRIPADVMEQYAAAH